MRFELLDRLIECSPERVVTIKQVSAAEEYLQDHFPGYPVLPGVLMLETMVQAARAWVERFHSGPGPVVLGEVRALKYNRFVRPGSTIRAEVEPDRASDEGWSFSGQVILLDPSGGEGVVAASGRFGLRPVRVGGGGVGGGAGGA